MLQIPTFQSKSSKFIQQITLDSRILNIDIAWNARSEYWFLSITDTESLDEINSIKIVPNWALLRQYKANMPELAGDFLVVKEDEEAEEIITYDNLNNGYALYYITQQEAEQWEDDNGVG